MAVVAQLRGRGIEIHAGCKVTAVTPREITLSDGTRISSFTLIWTAGTAPNPVLDLVDLPKERGRLKVAPTLQVEGRPEVWALGDCALIPDLKKGGFHPPTAQHASREGKILARNLVASVARVFGMNFSGFLAWWLWRTIYLSKLPRTEKKVRVALEWTLDLFFSKDFVQYVHHRQFRHAQLIPPLEAAPMREACEPEAKP